jgi:hypothetical protein
MTVAQDGHPTFQGVFHCVDLGDLAEAVSEGIRAFQKASPRLTKHAALGTLSIELKEAGQLKEVGQFKEAGEFKEAGVNG